jgi:hypothetical protein
MLLVSSTRSRLVTRLPYVPSPPLAATCAPRRFLTYAHPVCPNRCYTMNLNKVMYRAPELLDGAAGEGYTRAVDW